MLRRKKQIINALLVFIVLNMLSWHVSAIAQCEECSPQEQAAWREAGVEHLIARIGWAAQQQNFVGRYIVSQQDYLMALQTKHFFADQAEYELITTLVGDKHQIYRKDEEYYAVDLQRRQVFFDPQSMAQLFPFWGKPGYGHANENYSLSLVRHENFMGRDTDVIQVIPKDDIRFGYKVWLDRETGLLLRLEIEKKAGEILQRFTFAEIALNAVTEEQQEEIKGFIDTLKDAGYQIYEWPFVHVSPAEQGWLLTELPDGFEQVTFISRPRFLNEEHQLLQWVFSDGVASVSMFIEHMSENEDVSVSSLLPSGATHGVVFPFDEWKVTLVGEVPEKTLHAFALALKRISR